MPTYDYKCSACAHEFEVFQSITAGRLRKCPECGRMTLKRLIGAGAGVLFKGSGFYQTDYAGKSPAARKTAGKESEPAKPAETKTESKSETKPDAKPDAKK